jgi:hypothetical protein
MKLWTSQHRTANAFAGTFYFFSTHNSNAEKNKKSRQATAQGQRKLDTADLRPKRTTTHNSTFAIGGVSCSADSLVVAESFVLRIKFSGKNPAHRKSANRWQQV